MVLGITPNTKFVYSLKCALHTENNDNKAHFKSQCRDKRIFTFPALS